MYGFALIFLIIAPLLFQVIVGRKAVEKRIKLNFWVICLISLTLQIACSIGAFLMAADDFQKGLERNGPRCAMGLVGIIVITLFITLLLLIVMIAQRSKTKLTKISNERNI